MIANAMNMEETKKSNNVCFVISIVGWIVILSAFVLASRVSINEFTGLITMGIFYYFGIAASIIHLISFSVGLTYLIQKRCGRLGLVGFWASFVYLFCIGVYLAEIFLFTAG